MANLDNGTSKLKRMPSLAEWGLVSDEGVSSLATVIAERTGAVASTAAAATRTAACAAAIAYGSGFRPIGFEVPELPVLDLDTEGDPKGSAPKGPSILRVVTIGENTLLVKRFVWGVTVGDEGGAAKFFRSSTPRWTRPARSFVTCACGSSRAIRVAIVANRGPNETGPNNEGSFRVCDELVPSLLPLAPSPLRSTHVSDDPPGETVGTAFTKETSGAARSVSHHDVFCCTFASITFRR